MRGKLVLVQGDIGEARVEVVVNAWNRNFIPYWLLIPQGVAKALRKKAGRVPFQEVRAFGLLALGEAVETSAGNLEGVKSIFHVAALHAYWSSSPEAVALGAASLFRLAADRQVESIAIPLLGAGTGSVAPLRSLELIVEAWEAAKTAGYVPKRTEIYVYEAGLYRELLDTFFRVNEQWRKGVECLVAGEYWQAHEEWEDVWAILPESALRDALQGMIQFAAACYKPQQALAGAGMEGIQRGMGALVVSAAGYFRKAEAGVAGDDERAGPLPGFALAAATQGIQQLEDVRKRWVAGDFSLEEVGRRVAGIAAEVAAGLEGPFLGRMGDELSCVLKPRVG